MQKHNLIKLYRQAEDYFFSGIALKSLKLNESSTAYLTKDASLNFMYIADKEGASKENLTKAEIFFKDNNCSFELIIPSNECDVDVEATLEKRNYELAGKSVSMMLNLQNFEHGEPSNLIIGSTDDKLTEWMSPLIEAFQTTEAACLQYAKLHQKALDKQMAFYHFSLYVNSIPICSVTLSVHDKLARIDDVGTAPEFQRKGYATHLIDYALSVAKKMGAQYCFLESSSSGFSIYQKIGFDILFENKLYSRDIKP